MPRYVDGYVLPVPKKKIDAYRRLATKAGKVWREHGALEYLECAGDDLTIQGVASFTKLVKLKPGETVIFSFVVFKSRAHRDRVNAKVFADARLECMKDGAVPFDPKRMSYGGFTAIVDL
jgi:uncharacterized protein YbaA (DUF1428 family)